MNTQVAESITPFRSSFPFEVMEYIIASLDLSSQAAFSLTSREYNDEVDRFLWKSITIDTSVVDQRYQITYLHDHCDALLRVSRRAGYVRSLNIELWSFPAVAIPTALAHISRALTVLTSLIHLNCSIPPALDQDDASLLFSANKFIFRLNTLVLEDIDANMPSLRRFLASQPEITMLTLRDNRSVPCIPNFPISTLPNLRHVDANCSIVDALVPHRPISSARLFLVFEDLSFPNPTLSILSQSPVQILELDLHLHRNDPLHEIAKQFPSLRFLRPYRHCTTSRHEVLPAFPELQVLWCETRPRKGFYTPEEFAVWASNCPSLHTVLFGANYSGYGRTVWLKRPGGSWISHPSSRMFHYDFSHEHYVFPRLLVDLGLGSAK